MPIYDIIKNTIFEEQDILEENSQKMIELTIELYEVLSKELNNVNFWSDDIAQKRLKRQIADFLKSSRLIVISDIKTKENLVEKIVNLAKHLDKKLIN